MATLQQIVAHLKQYGAKYPIPALKAQLLKQGIPAATIDQAIATLQQQAVAYLRQYSAKYPIATLKAQLIKQGLPPATIDQAVAAVQPQAKAAPGQAPVAQPAQPAQPAQAAQPAQPARPAPQPGTTQGSPVQAAPKSGAFKPPPGRNFILVVDDDPLIRDMLVAKLEGAGYRVTCAEDAAQSVIQAEGMRLSLIISDIEMPGFGTGVDALKKLRASSYIPKNLPVIFVTGMPPAEAQKIVPKSDPYIRLMHKPVDWKLLAKYMLDLSGLDKPLD
jgi:CheY-like chemotaxis protein